MTNLPPSVLSDVLVLLADLADARITAIVGSETDCHPGRYRLDVAGRRLWQQHHDDRFGDCLKVAADDLSIETMTALLAAGVPYKEG